MKKFLDLKKNIVNCKNQPILIQTFLDSIRSSCYKLSIPQLFEGYEQVFHHNICNIAEKNLCQNSSNLSARSSQKTQKINISHIYAKSDGQENEKNSGRNKYKKIRFLDENNSNLDSLNDKTHKRRDKIQESLKKTQKIDQIFSHIESQCQSSPQKILSEQMVYKILQQVNILQKNIENNHKNVEEMRQPINLIKQLIHLNIKNRNQQNKSFVTMKKFPAQSFPVSSNQNTKIQNKIKKNFNLALERENRQLYEYKNYSEAKISKESQQDSQQGQDLFPLKITYVKKKKIISSRETMSKSKKVCKTEHCNELEEQKQHSKQFFQSPKSQNFLSALSEHNSVVSSESNRYCTIKYQRFLPNQLIGDEYEDISEKNSKLRHNQSIQIYQESFDHEQGIIFANQQDSMTNSQSNSFSNNTMLSQDLNGWSNDKLYRISEKQEQESEQSISKRTYEKKMSFCKQDSLKQSKKGEVCQNNNNEQIGKRYRQVNFEEKCEQKLQELSETIQFKKIRYMLQSGSTNKKDKLLLKDILNKNFQSNGNHKNLFHNNFGNQKENKMRAKTPKQQMSVLRIKQRSQKIITQDINEENKQQKKKTIKEIVNLLNSKYHRNFEFKKLK